MYLQTCPMDHSCRPSIPFNEENATNDMEILATSDVMRGNFEMDTDEGEGTLAIMTQSVIIAFENYVDIPLTNEDCSLQNSQSQWIVGAFTSHQSAATCKTNKKTTEVLCRPSDGKVSFFRMTER